MSSEPCIRIEGVSKSFRGHLGIGRHTAVRDLDLDVQPGETFGLLGPNGSGKTTTLKMMLGLLRPSCGTIRLFGRPSRDPGARARVGYLPENPYFYDYLTAREFLDFYARLQGISSSRREERVSRALERVGLKGRGDVALRKFSKGMIQRVGLAQAIQHDPELIILDEPMSGLDPIGRREVRDLILSLREDGRTVFFSSHILQDAEMICDRVAILQRGELRSIGRLDELVAHKVRWFEVELRGTDVDSIDCERLSGEGGKALVKVPDVQALSELIVAVHDQGGQVASVWPRRETLEDLFMREIGRGEPAP